MKKIIFSLSILFVSIITMIINISNGTTYASDFSFWKEYTTTTDNGSPGESYSAQIRCTTTTTTTDITYYPWTGGDPVEQIQISTNTDVKYVTATLCNYYPAMTLCTEQIPC